MVTPKSFLQKHLDHQKFLHVVDYVRKESSGIKKLSTTEISRTNKFLAGKQHDDDYEPYRLEAVDVILPDGRVIQFSIISNPMAKARDIIGNALFMSGNGQGIEGAAYAYLEFVKAHLFKVANRRTAVAAALWVLLVSGYDCDAEKLHYIPIGDVREKDQIKEIEKQISALVFKP